LRDVVFTEYDLRSRLHDHIEGGGSVDSWAREIGLLLPPDTVATRASVVTELSKRAFGWKSLRTPILTNDAINHNARIVDGLGLADAPTLSFGRRSFNAIEMTIDDATEQLVKAWMAPAFGADWRHEQIIDAMNRFPHRSQPVKVLLLQGDEGAPRIRRWDPMVGFINLFQGRDNLQSGSTGSYPGDRAIPGIESEPDQVAIQVHRVRRRDYPDDPINLFTLAVYLGERQVIKTIESSI